MKKIEALLKLGFRLTEDAFRVSKKKKKEDFMFKKHNKRENKAFPKLGFQKNKKVSAFKPKFFMENENVKNESSFES